MSAIDLNGITADGVARTLNQSAWTLVRHEAGRVAVYRGPQDDGGRPILLVLPLDPAAEDLHWYLEAAVKALAALERTTGRAVVEAILQESSAFEPGPVNPEVSSWLGEPPAVTLPHERSEELAVVRAVDDENDPPRVTFRLTCFACRSLIEVAVPSVAIGLITQIDAVCRDPGCEETNFVALSWADLETPRNHRGRSEREVTGLPDSVRLLAHLAAVERAVLLVQITRELASRHDATAWALDLITQRLSQVLGAEDREALESPEVRRSLIEALALLVQRPSTDP